MNTMTPFGWAVFLLGATTAVGALALIHIWTRDRVDGLNLRMWLVINFLVANVLSGFAHVLGWSRDRGFYEAMSGTPAGATSGLTTAAWATFLGMCALWAGLTIPRPRILAAHRGPRQVPRRPLVPEQLYSFVSHHRVSMGGLALVLVAAGAVGLVRVMGATTDQTGGRIISVDGGNARYAFLAGWLPWGITILVLALASRKRVPGPAVWNTIILVAGLAALGVSATWNGGRSEIAYVAFPLLALMLPRINVLRWPLIVVGVTVFVGFIIATTAQRVGATTDPWSFVDWQWGRFSMAAWAENHVQFHGALHGETLLSALLNVPLALLHFAGIPAENPFRSMVQVSGYDLLGGEDQIYVVPGLSAEMILNFGLLGAIVGYFVLGLVSAMVSDAYSRSRSETNRLLLATVGSTLVFQGIVGQLESLEVFLTLSILPLWGLWIVERIFGRGDTKSPPAGIRSSPATELSPRTPAVHK